MPEISRPHEVTGLTAGELERVRRELRASVALVWPGCPARAPIPARLKAIEAELTRRGAW